MLILAQWRVQQVLHFRVQAVLCVFNAAWSCHSHQLCHINYIISWWQYCVRIWEFWNHSWGLAGYSPLNPQSEGLDEIVTNVTEKLSPCTHEMLINRIWPLCCNLLTRIQICLLCSSIVKYLWEEQTKMIQGFAVSDKLWFGPVGCSNSAVAWVAGRHVVWSDAKGTSSGLLSTAMSSSHLQYRILPTLLFQTLPHHLGFLITPLQ